MSVYLLRRRKLGKTSCNEIQKFSENIAGVIRNDQAFPPDISMVIRWGTTSNIPCTNVLNTSEAIHKVADKAGFRNVLMNDFIEQQSGVGTPLCPFTWFAEEGVIQPHDYPLVVRPKTHSQGKHVYLVNTEQELNTAIQKCGDGWYASSYINKVAEYRVAFVCGRVSWVAKKTPGNPQAIAWNVAQGGRFDNVNFDAWPLKAVKIARKAFMLSGLHFGGVDVMVDAEGSAYVLEINSAPSQTSPYRQECMAKCFDWTIVNGKTSIPIIKNTGDWKKFIHPAISDKAIMV